jgi:predicted nucleotidyltransferase
MGIIMDDKTVFVISEFNPFHHGHRYLIDTLHKDFGTVVCVMSGNSVQRGTVACAEKYLRARTAVENGVNLVVELPFPFCSLSAADFVSQPLRIQLGHHVSALAKKLSEGMSPRPTLPPFLRDLLGE